MDRWLNPLESPMRVEFELAVVLATISEAGDIAKSKNWGTIVKIEPLRRDDYLYPRNITYCLKASSSQRIRWEFLDSFKNILGLKRRLVNEAMRESKGRFIKGLLLTTPRLSGRNSS